MSTTPPPVVVYPVPRGSDRLWAFASHLSGLVCLPIILPLVVYLAMRRESTYVADNAREALNFHLSLALYSLILAITVVGLALIWAVGLVYVIFTIIAVIKASEDNCYRYPLTIRFVK